MRTTQEATTFELKRYGVRVHVQRDSILNSQKAFGPIKVSKLKETMEFKGRELQGILQVQFLSDGSRFDAPVLLDFLVSGKDKDQIIDERDRTGYEVRCRERSVDGCTVFGLSGRVTSEGGLESRME